MSIFNIINLFGGLALFLYGMTVMSTNLEKLSGSRLEKTLESFTNKTWKGVLLGLVVTGIIQSSSATTVIVVGLVNSGVMRLRQAIGVIMGANIGTTVTAQILRLGDISSDNFFVQIFKPSSLSPIVAVIGLILIILFHRAVRSRSTQKPIITKVHSSVSFVLFFYAQVHNSFFSPYFF